MPHPPPIIPLVLSRSHSTVKFMLTCAIAMTHNTEGELAPMHSTLASWWRVPSNVCSKGNSEGLEALRVGICASERNSVSTNVSVSADHAPARHSATSEVAKHPAIIAASLHPATHLWAKRNSATKHTSSKGSRKGAGKEKESSSSVSKRRSKTIPKAPSPAALVLADATAHIDCEILRPEQEWLAGTLLLLDVKFIQSYTDSDKKKPPFNAPKASTVYGEVADVRFVSGPKTLGGADFDDFGDPIDPRELAVLLQQHDHGHDHGSNATGAAGAAGVKGAGKYDLYGRIVAKSAVTHMTRSRTTTTFFYAKMASLKLTDHGETLTTAIIFKDTPAYFHHFLQIREAVLITGLKRTTNRQTQSMMRTSSTTNIFHVPDNFNPRTSLSTPALALAASDDANVKRRRLLTASDLKGKGGGCPAADAHAFTCSNLVSPAGNSKLPMNPQRIYRPKIDHIPASLCIPVYEEGVLTGIVGDRPLQMVLEIDGKFLLYCSHYEFVNCGRGLRIGAVLRLHNVHKVMPYPNSKRTRAFGCCTYSFIEVVRFAPFLEPLELMKPKKTVLFQKYASRMSLSGYATFLNLLEDVAVKVWICCLFYWCPLADSLTTLQCDRHPESTNARTTDIPCLALPCLVKK